MRSSTGVPLPEFHNTTLAFTAEIGPARVRETGMAEDRKGLSQMAQNVMVWTRLSPSCVDYWTTKTDPPAEGHEVLPMNKTDVRHIYRESTSW